MKKHVCRTLILSILMMLIISINPPSSFAHQRQLFQIGDKKYLFVIGSINEPVYVDDKSGLELTIKQADPQAPTDSQAVGATPVLGLQESLQAELIAGDKKLVLPLTAVHGQLGNYKAEFFPTVETEIRYRVFGEINQIPVDLTFTCNPIGHLAAGEDSSEITLGENVSRLYLAGSFGCPQRKTELTFPEVVSNSQATDQKLLADVAQELRKYQLLLAASLLLSVLSVSWQVYRAFNSKNE